MNPGQSRAPCNPSWRAGRRLPSDPASCIRSTEALGLARVRCARTSPRRDSRIFFSAEFDNFHGVDANRATGSFCCAGLEMTDAALALCPTHSIQKQQMAPCTGLRLFKLDRRVCRRRLVPRRALLPCVVVQERDCGVLHNARVFTRSVTPLPHQLRECVTHANVSDNTCAQAWPD